MKPNHRLVQSPAPNMRLRVELRDLFGRPRDQPHRVASAPKTVAHYELVKKIGIGATAVVYLARDKRLNRLVALKMLRHWGTGDQASKRRFLREATYISALSDPHVVTVYEMGRCHGTPYLVMEFVTGSTMDWVIPRRGMRLDRFLEYAIQIARGLEAIHRAGLVHRDLKPSNLIVAKNQTIKILDFSLAKQVVSADESKSRGQRPAVRETREGTILGTAGFMSPEQVRGESADQRSDIFSFGAILYEMLTGRRAFQGGNSIETMTAILHHTPRPLPRRVPQGISKIVWHCLAKKPSQRYQTIEAIALDLIVAAKIASPPAHAEVRNRPRRC